jgi:hypothetical protein
LISGPESKWFLVPLLRLPSFLLLLNGLANRHSNRVATGEFQEEFDIGEQAHDAYHVRREQKHF